MTGNISTAPPWHIESTLPRMMTLHGVIISATEGPIAFAPAIAASMIITRVNCHEELVAALADCADLLAQLLDSSQHPVVERARAALRDAGDY